MSLRLQLLAVGLLTLVLPWTGFRYVQEMETALRAGLEQSLLAQRRDGRRGARRAKRDACARRPTATRSAPARRSMRRRSRASPSSTAFATTIGTRPTTPALAIGGGHELWAGTYGRFVYLFVSVADRDLVYQRQAGQPPYGDRVVRRGRGRALLAGGCSNTAAPGAFRAQETGPDRFEPSETYDGRSHRRVAGDGRAAMRSKSACR